MTTEALLAHFDALDPGRLPGHLAYLPHLPLPRNLRWAVQAARPMRETREPRARLRLVEFRGKLGAAMIYDDKPIIDHFRREDAATLLGLMDLRGMAQPFFFRLRRG